LAGTNHEPWERQQVLARERVQRLARADTRGRLRVGMRRAEAAPLELVHRLRLRLHRFLLLAAAVVAAQALEFLFGERGPQGDVGQQRQALIELPAQHVQRDLGAVEVALGAQLGAHGLDGLGQGQRVTSDHAFVQHVGRQRGGALAVQGCRRPSRR
jgi:hypothetical protein